MFIPALNDARSTPERRVAKLLQDKKKTLPVQLAYMRLIAGVSLRNFAPR